MLSVNVHIHVKLEYIKEFIHATIENVMESIKEPGVARFDFFQSVDDMSRFLLLEVYRNDSAALEHKKTAHYLKWRDTVEKMMEEPRVGLKFIKIFPDVDSDLQ